MFGRNTNNYNNEASTNTTFYQSYSDTSSLTVGAWNRYISVKISPCTGTDESGIRQYDRNKRINKCISMDNASAISHIIRDTILPKIKEVENGADLVEEPKSPLISMGGRDSKGALAIEYKKDERGIPSVYLVVYLTIESNNTTSPDNIFRHKFPKREVVMNYDPITGDGTVKYMEGDFRNFCEILNNAISILPMASHGIKYDKATSGSFSRPTPSNNFGSGIQDGEINTPSGFDDELPFR